MKDVVKDLKRVANPRKALILSGYFKTGKGEYAEGDIMLGVTVPKQRIIAKRYYRKASLADIKKLLWSDIHEHRFTGLEMLVMKYEEAKNKKEFFDFYIKNRERVNNWDLVDTSAPYIVGDYLFYRPRNLLYRLAKSKRIWDRRIAVVATYVFIKNRDFSDICEIAEMLFDDPHPLIHKACGWMLREMGKKDQSNLISFLNKNHTKMPRIMLSYAIERLSKTAKVAYTKKYVSSSL